MKSILLVGDDGKTYQVKTKDFAKIATSVNTTKLSPDVQANIADSLKKKKGEKGVAHILAAKTDILTASKADILVSGKADILTHAKSDILVSKKKAAKKKAAPKTGETK
jgi:hypothetical protein